MGDDGEEMRLEREGRKEKRDGEETLGPEALPDTRDVARRVMCGLAAFGSLPACLEAWMSWCPRLQMLRALTHVEDSLRICSNWTFCVLACLGSAGVSVRLEALPATGNYSIASSIIRAPSVDGNEPQLEAAWKFALLSSHSKDLARRQSHILSSLILFGVERSLRANHSAQRVSAALGCWTRHHGFTVAPTPIPQRSSNRYESLRPGAHVC
jgi:hypothetical protein